MSGTLVSTVDGWPKVRTSQHGYWISFHSNTKIKHGFFFKRCACKRSYLFADKRTLSRHELRHTAAKHIKCDLCDYTTNVDRSDPLLRTFSVFLFLMKTAGRTNLGQVFGSGLFRAIALSAPTFSLTLTLLQPLKGQSKDKWTKSCRFNLTLDTVNWDNVWWKNVLMAIFGYADSNLMEHRRRRHAEQIGGSVVSDKKFYCHVCGKPFK